MKHPLLMRFTKSEAGNAIVEFALIVPVFLLMLFGMIDVGRLYWTVSTMEYAVEAAGRYAMINTSASSNQIIAQAQDNLYAIAPSSVTFTTSTNMVNGVNYMTIQAQNTFTFLPYAMSNFGTTTLIRVARVPILP